MRLGLLTGMRLCFWVYAEALPRLQRTIKWVTLLGYNPGRALSYLRRPVAKADAADTLSDKPMNQGRPAAAANSSVPNAGPAASLRSLTILSAAV